MPEDLNDGARRGLAVEEEHRSGERGARRSPAQNGQNRNRRAHPVHLPGI